MSQTSQAPTPAAPAASGVGTGGNAQGRAAAAVANAAADPGRGRRDQPVVDVPALLNRWQVVAVAACVLFAVLTAVLQVLSWNANRAAATNTEQLVRVQNIQSTLLNADALATSAFLIGGLEPPAQRAAYDEAIADVTRQVADAAEAQPADREALAALNQAVTTYASTITQARDNNRQGFPVGSAYLGEASSSLRTDTLPIVAALVDANSDRAESEIGDQRPYLVILPGLAALLALWWVNRGLAAQFRRRFNVGVAGAFVAIALTAFAGTAVSAGQLDANGNLLDGSFATAVDEATARSAGNDARANESLRLINRGSGAPFEAAYGDAADVVRDNATARTLGPWGEYDALHDAVVTADDGGQWDTAVAQATSTDTFAAFDAFDTSAQQIVDEQSKATTDTLLRGNTGILALAVVSLLVGLASAAACTWGIAARRREYS